MTEAALDRCLVSFQAKRHRWRSWWVAQMSLRVNLCERKICWEFNSTPIMHMLFCISCLLILRTLSKCYCLKCNRISPISLFYISQGSEATLLRCGGQCGISFVANFLANTIVRKIWKSANICQSYERMYSGTVFWPTVYTYFRFCCAILEFYFPFWFWPRIVISMSLCIGQFGLQNFLQIEPPAAELWCHIEILRRRPWSRKSTSEF